MSKINETSEIMMDVLNRLPYSKLLKFFLFISIPVFLATVPLKKEKIESIDIPEESYIEETSIDFYNPSLAQNFPNSFRRTTTISYTIPTSDRVNLTVYDMYGNQKGQLVNKEQKAGTYLVQLDALPLDNGLYLYKLQVGDFVDAKTMLLMR